MLPDSAHHIYDSTISLEEIWLHTRGWHPDGFFVISECSIPGCDQHLRLKRLAPTKFAETPFKFDDGDSSHLSNRPSTGRARSRTNDHQRLAISKRALFKSTGYSSTATTWQEYLLDVSTSQSVDADTRRRFCRAHVFIRDGSCLCGFGHRPIKPRRHVHHEMSGLDLLSQAIRFGVKSTADQATADITEQGECAFTSFDPLDPWDPIRASLLKGNIYAKSTDDQESTATDSAETADDPVDDTMQVYLQESRGNGGFGGVFGH